MSKLLLSVLALVVGYQRVGAEDKPRLYLLDEEKERLETEIGHLAQPERTDALNLLSAALQNAWGQPADTANHGGEFELHADSNPLGLASGARELRVRKREGMPGVLFGKTSPAVAEPAETAAGEPQESEPVPLDFKGRVRAEHATVSENGGKLFAFMQGETFKTLPEAERNRLTRQLRVMREYVSILEDRIANFEEKPVDDLATQA